MAIITTSGLISEIHGKIGGIRFQRSKSGIIVSSNSYPANKNSNLQNISRVISSNLLNAWTNLSDSQRLLWHQFIQYMPVHQKDNKSLFLSDQQTFIKFNSYRLHYSLPILISPKFYKCAISPISLSAASDDVNLTIQADRAMISNDEFIILFMTIVFSSSINNPGSRYKLIKLVTTNTDVYNITSLYTAIFGRIPQSGETLFIKYTNASKASGFLFPFKSVKILL